MIRRLLLDRQGDTIAEFALVLPLLLVLLFGIVDSGRFLWEVNRAEKATQAGARFAVVAAPLAPGLATANYVGVDGLTQGDTIPASELGTVTCNQTACCNPTSLCATPYPTLGTYNATSTSVFTNLSKRMQVLDPAIQPANILVSYSGSGLGFAGNPNGAQISPIVTVKLTGVQFKPITFFLFKTITLPDFRTSLTAEDLSGTQSN